MLETDRDLYLSFAKFMQMDFHFMTDLIDARRQASPDLARALKGAPTEAVRILLDHRPGQAPLNAMAGLDLQLSGHTHGGQMPIMSQLVTAANNGFLRGLYAVRDMSLYVNSGAGLWNGFPVRLGVPGEISRIVLRAALPA